MKTSTLKWIIVLMGISLVGMIGFQLYWIDSVISANEERFTKDVMQAMNNVAVKLEKQETVSALNKFHAVDALTPDFRTTGVPKNRPFDQFNRDHNQFNRDQTLANLRGSGQNHEGFFQPQQQGEHIMVYDTIQSQGFQVVFNYEFLNIPQRNFPFGPTTDPGGVNAELEMELEEKESQIAQLEDQVAWYARKYDLISDVIGDLVTPNRGINHRLHPDQLDSLLELELHDKGIHLDYDYGVVAPSLNQFVYMKDPDMQPELETSELRASLFPNDLTGNAAFLVVDFPGKSRYLLEKIWMTMVSSGVLVLVIVLCFGYSIRAIIRQKKLSLMKNDFINNMTHEFKTPIATVSLATEALQDKDVSKSDGMSARYVKMIQDENHRLGTQVERVLQIAAIEKQDFNLVKEELDLHEMIKSLVDNMKIQVESRGGRVTTVLNAAISEIKGDETHITNCIINLLDNANKYSPDSPNIIIRTESHRDTITVSVQDHGIGMSRDAQKQVFEKFYRVPTGNRHDVKGFGLGLSYVRNMVEAHDGRIEVDSTPGKGSKFTMTLPLN